MWQIWLIIAGAFLILEIMTHGFLVFWFALGAIFAMIASFITDSIVIQTIVFVVFSTLLIFATKPLTKKLTQKISATNQTNAFSIIGKVGIVTENIDPINSSGLIKLNGETWSATSLNNVHIPKGTEIKVVEIKGVKTVVTPVEISSKI